MGVLDYKRCVSKGPDINWPNLFVITGFWNIESVLQQILNTQTNLIPTGMHVL